VSGYVRGDDWLGSDVGQLQLIQLNEAPILQKTANTLNGRVEKRSGPNIGVSPSSRTVTPPLDAEL
jgi:hypothetical protein